MPRYFLLCVMLFAGCDRRIDVSGPDKVGGRSTQMPVASLQAAELPSVPFFIDVPPAEVREWFFNPDGSCVQCAIGQGGVKGNKPEASTLLWDSQYGPAVRGGSDPSRVARYCQARGIKAYNVTGEYTIPLMKWACRNGLGAAISADSRHFQFLEDYDPKTGTWYVNDNRVPRKVTAYSDAEFIRLHSMSYKWTVILRGPAMPPPVRYVKWW